MTLAPRRSGMRLALLLSLLSFLHSPAAISQALGSKPISAAAAGSPAVSAEALDVARLTADEKLTKPVDLEEWVFLGTSLGMGYNQAQFDPASPGQFQVVLMEPQAYRYFKAHGHYAPGSMFLLAFYNADQRRSINKNGFVQSDLATFEIHLVDARKSSDGRLFYLFSPNDTESKPLPKGNDCVRCHLAHGAFEGTFAQFYPTLRNRIPKDALERALKDHDIR